MKQLKTEYYCENCKKKLPTFLNKLCIVTVIDDSNISWSRLAVVIMHKHGSHNESQTEPADLCQECAYKLLIDAADRIKKGERASSGVESPNKEKWEQKHDTHKQALEDVKRFLKQLEDIDHDR